MTYNKLFIALALVSLLCIVGCSDGRPARFPVKGTVQLDGKPLTGNYSGFIRLIPVGQGRPASGEIDPATGTFTLGNYEESDGCPRGEYNVEVTAYIVQNMKLKHVVPPRCNDSKKSAITVNIDGKNENLIINVQTLPEDKGYENNWETIGG